MDDAPPVPTPPNNPVPSGGSPPGPGGPPPGGPAAAKIVLTGPKSEREISLETDLESERSSHAKTAKDKKDREVRIAELEDELHRLRAVAKPEAKKSLLDISEFFED